ncbi:unnamed protein product [Medioppia subpectinata]|uniref:THUMP domain-containing protein n=1 Tax=Medioppia subpectinata TaxID=1979941 RepID=A0A7R9Q3M5_9ACAR|nr:unnamed protein product [Medioppia subpectinata]CAG2111432.1 unnamed protein product [Medioppia subpectinata]
MAAMPELTTYEATVVTGLEWIAAEECVEKLATKKVTQSHGRVFIETDRPVQQVFDLKSVDNIYAVIYDNASEEVPKNAEELSQKLTSISTACDWSRGLKTWMDAYNWTKCDLKTILDTNADLKDMKPAFRVTANRTGDHKFNSHECAVILGAIINDTYHWKVSMKEFDIEVVLNVRDNHFYVCLALTRESLHRRNLVCFGPTSLRATIAYNMLRMANVQLGDIVCDPMCGSGAIPVECAHNWQTFGIAADNHPVAVERTQTNCRHNKSLTDVNQWDVTALPFRSDSIDVFITDLPFGKRLGSKHDNKTLYPALLQQLSRCIRVGTGRMVLLTQDKRNMIQSLQKPYVSKYWKVVRKTFVRIGGLDASIFVLKRNALPFTPI